jgi:hypothetical protein
MKRKCTTTLLDQSIVVKSGFEGAAEWCLPKSAGDGNEIVYAFFHIVLSFYRPHFSNLFFLFLQKKANNQSEKRNNIWIEFRSLFLFLFCKVIGDQSAFDLFRFSAFFHVLIKKTIVYWRRSKNERYYYKNQNLLTAIIGMKLYTLYLSYFQAVKKKTSLN